MMDEAGSRCSGGEEGGKMAKRSASAPSGDRSTGRKPALRQATERTTAAAARRLLLGHGAAADL